MCNFQPNVGNLFREQRQLSIRHSNQYEAGSCAIIACSLARKYVISVYEIHGY